MVQRALVREDVHEAQVEPVHRHRPGQRRQRVEPADLPEPAARVPRLLQQRQRHPARRAQVPPPLLRHPLEEGRLRQARHPPDPEELLQVAEGDRRVQLGTRRPADRSPRTRPAARRRRALAGIAPPPPPAVVTGARYGTSSGYCVRTVSTTTGSVERIRVPQGSSSQSLRYSAATSSSPMTPRVTTRKPAA